MWRQLMIDEKVAGHEAGSPPRIMNRSRESNRSCSERHVDSYGRVPVPALGVILAANTFPLSITCRKSIDSRRITLELEGQERHDL